MLGGDVPLQWRFDGRIDAASIVVLAHGAGTDMYAPILESMTSALNAHDIGVFRFNQRYQTMGRRAPDRPAVLWATTLAAVEVAADHTDRETASLIVGGRSMGGRYMSMIAAGDDEHPPVPVAGLLLAGYPLYPPGKPDKVRADHFPRITCPTLIIQGTRDTMATPEALLVASEMMGGSVELCWLPDADHGFKPRKSSGYSPEDCALMASDASVEWVQRVAALTAESPEATPPANP